MTESSRNTASRRTREPRHAAPRATLLERDGRPSLLSDLDLHLFNEGAHFGLADHLGAHRVEHGGEGGVLFGVWAPNAASVHVIGEFNGWNKDADPLNPVASSGLWEGFVPGVENGARYKFHVRSAVRSFRVDKSDPFAAYCESPPSTASVVHDPAYEWQDREWMEQRGRRNAFDAPASIYEVHLGSWRRRDDGGLRGYRDLADELVEHVLAEGFTHVEFLPLTEHPFHGSWGYQTTAYFAPSARYGTPQDLMFLIDTLHRAGIGVILDWVPSHFPSDEHGLVYFDGTHLFEHEDPRRGFHPDWQSYIFNYGRNEVRSFLISSAMMWLSRYHIDGLRVDAVASMLYRDYSRREGEWVPNAQGGRENEEAISFLQRLNQEIHRVHPDVQTIAEESTAWPGVTRSVEEGGLGFGLKWDMGWMHDSLQYFRREPIHRKFHHDDLTFRAMYAQSERYVLSLSHDEVVHGKGSLLDKMAGDDWQRFANLRLLLAWMFGQPGKQLLFMGAELAQPHEWSHDASLAWHLLDAPRHAGIARFVSDLNRLHRERPALHELDCEPGGFEWIDADDRENSCFSFLRIGREGDAVAVVLNATPIPRRNYRLGVTRAGTWHELLNSDSVAYGGSGQGNFGARDAVPVARHGRPLSLNLTLPPLGALFLGAPTSD